jgi:ABC-type glycerol-3-phosphate transport system substrate-binding protein
MARTPPRRYEAGMITQNRFLSLLTLACALTLAACAQGNNTADLAPSAQPAAAQPAAAAPPKGPMTPEQAKADCWMKYEEDKKIKNIDQRLALVEKCVDTTMRGQLVARPDR